MNCYDYENQKWVGGTEGAKLCANQLRQELEILRSEDGLRYLQFSWGGLPLADNALDLSIASAVRQLAIAEKLSINTNPNQP